MYAYLLFLILSLLALLAILYPVRQNRKFCIIVATLFMTGALGLYSIAGSPGIIAAIDVHDNKMAEARKTISYESVQLMQKPDNLEAWIRLGQAYAQREEWEKAADAFKRSVVLSNGQPDLIMAYARSLIMNADGRVSDHASESLHMVLLQNPQHAEARYYKAVRTLQEGQTHDAMQQMKELYHSLPDDSPIKEMINIQLGRN